MIQWQKLPTPVHLRHNHSFQQSIKSLSYFTVLFSLQITTPSSVKPNQEKVGSKCFSGEGHYLLSFLPAFLFPESKCFGFMSNTCLSASPFFPKRFIFFWAFFIIVLAFFTIYKGKEKPISCENPNFQVNFHYLLTLDVNSPGLCYEEKPWWASLTPFSRGHTTVPAGWKLPDQSSICEDQTLSDLQDEVLCSVLLPSQQSARRSGHGATRTWLTSGNAGIKSRLLDEMAPWKHTACQFIYRLSHLYEFSKCWN